MHGLLTQLSSNDPVLDIGGGKENRIKLYYPHLTNVTNVDLCTGYNLDTSELPEGHWKLLFANHIIEHLQDVDFLLDNCMRVMDNDSFLEIGTPNLVAWFNRVLFNFGYLPHSYEVSKYHNVGKIKIWSDEEMGGHIHVFSPMALCKLLRHHGFKVLKVQGEASTYPTNPVISWVDKMLTLNPNMASAFRVLCSL